MHPLLLILALVMAAPPASAEAPFSERAREWGIDFVHFNGMTGKLYFIENVGSGAGLFDYDGDGDPDVYLIQGAVLDPEGTPDSATFPPPPAMRPLRDRLYRNDLVIQPDGRVEPRFVDVTAAAGLDASGYGMGLAVADFDNDSWLDLFVANFGADHLFHNLGDGTFEDWSSRIAAGAPGAAGADRATSVAATTLDADGDGATDLYVVRYVGFSPERNKVCSGAASFPDYCGPLAFRPLPDLLLHNRGDGTFEDWSSRAGLDRLPATGLSAVAGDFTGDGRDDLFVANDQMENLLLVNRGGGKFSEEGLLAGIALNEQGQTEGSMGIAVGDVDRDGDPELFLTHMQEETNTLYRNLGGGLFEDATLGSGLGRPSLPYTGFGTDFFDYDLDGELDLFVANGSVRVLEGQLRAGETYPLRQPNQLFRGLGGGRFEEVTAEAGPAFSLREVSRGAAFGDLEGDGDVDVLVANNAGPARLLVNEVGSASAWVGVRVTDRLGRDAVGARVAASAAAGEGPGTTTRWDRVHFDGSYASVSDPRLVFGFGGDRRSRELSICWPSGERRVIRGLPSGVYAVVPARRAGGGPGRGD